MKVNAPNVAYEVNTTTDENIIIDKCLEVLENITNTMDYYHCDTLDYGYPETPETITRKDIRTIKNILFTLKDINTMY